MKACMGLLQVRNVNWLIELIVLTEMWLESACCSLALVDSVLLLCSKARVEWLASLVFEIPKRWSYS